MNNAFYHNPSPQSEEEFLRRDEECARRFERWTERQENNGEWLAIDPETGCTPEEMERKPVAQEVAHQMSLPFEKQEVA